MAVAELSESAKQVADTLCIRKTNRSKFRFRVGAEECSDRRAHSDLRLGFGLSQKALPGTGVPRRWSGRKPRLVVLWSAEAGGATYVHVRSRARRLQKRSAAHKALGQEHRHDGEQDHDADHYIHFRQMLTETYRAKDP